jgi:hypothetical protein
MDGDQPVGVAAAGGRSERFESFLNYQVHWGAWLLLAAAVLLLAIDLPRGDLSWPSVGYALGDISTLVFAAAVVMTAGDRRLLVAGAVTLAVPTLLDLSYRLLDLSFPALRPIDFLDIPRSFTGILACVGLVLIGRAIGGLRSRRSVAVTVAFGLVAVAVIAWQLSRTIDMTDMVPPPGEGGPILFLGRPPEMIIGTLGGIIWLGWGYLLAAALDQRLRWLAAAAVLTVVNLALSLAEVVWIVLLPPAPSTEPFGFVGPIEAVLAAGSFACLLISAFVELKGVGWTYPREESASR